MLYNVNYAVHTNILENFNGRDNNNFSKENHDRRNNTPYNFLESQKFISTTFYLSIVEFSTSEHKDSKFITT